MTGKVIRSRRSSSDDSLRRNSLQMVEKRYENGNNANKYFLILSSSHLSLQSVDLGGSPPVRSRSSSLHSGESLKSFSAGVLCLIVHSARNLEKKGMFGKADPYVLVTFGSKKSRSKSINNSQV